MGSLNYTYQIADKNCEVTSQCTKASISLGTPDNTAGLLERIEKLTHQDV